GGSDVPGAIFVAASVNHLSSPRIGVDKDGLKGLLDSLHFDPLKIIEGIKDYFENLASSLVDQILKEVPLIGDQLEEVGKYIESIADRFVQTLTNDLTNATDSIQNLQQKIQDDLNQALDQLTNAGPLAVAAGVAVPQAIAPTLNVKFEPDRLEITGE